MAFTTGLAAGVTGAPKMAFTTGLAAAMNYTGSIKREYLPATAIPSAATLTVTE